MSANPKHTLVQLFNGLTLESRREAFRYCVEVAYVPSDLTVRKVGSGLYMSLALLTTGKHLDNRSVVETIADNQHHCLAWMSLQGFNIEGLTP